MALRQLDRHLWVVERRQRFFGLEVGCRMTVIRIAGDHLLLHSAVALDPALRRELDALGEVRYVVAPNRFHHLHAGDVATQYPAARLWVGPGVETKRPDLVYEAILDDEAPAPWRGEVDQVFFRGRPMENEVTFFHRASRTLVLCDLAFNFGPSAPMSTRLVGRLLGTYRGLRPSRLDPFLIKDRAQARASLEKILAWDFDRIIIAHGDVQEQGGREVLRAGYEWLLGP